MQNHFSLLNRSSADSGILDYCKANDITFYGYMTLEQGALSGKYDTAHPMPEGSARAKVFNPILDKIEGITAEMKAIAEAHRSSVAQIGTAYAIDRLVTDPQIAGARDMFPEIDQPGIGKLHITATAQKLTRTKAYPRKPAPLLGEDNASVYGELLGFDTAKLAKLKEKGVI